MERSALPTGPREARPSRLIPRGLWNTSLRHLPRPTRSVVSRDSDVDDGELRQIEGVACNPYHPYSNTTHSSVRTRLLCMYDEPMADDRWLEADGCA